MSSATLQVVIIGGGIGGLCLAQGLKKAGVSVAVHERDRSPTDRLQGFRLHIGPGGSRALHDCLPPALHDTLVATSGRGANRFRFLSETLEELIEIAPEPSADPVACHRSVSRVTLRQVLLTGLEDVMHFDRTFLRYDVAPGGRIRAHFADGSSAAADVLVGADGGNSRVRQQMLPQAERIDTGAVGIAGKFLLTDGTRPLLSPTLLRSPALVKARGCGMFIAQMERQAQEQLGGNDAADPGPLPDDISDYVMWGFGARRASFGDAELDALDARALQALVLTRIAGWHPELRKLVRLSDPATIALLPFRTAVPVDAWEPSRVTLIGDAIHSMTPYRGIGATVALRDAALLAHNLAAAAGEKLPLLQAIGNYEREMRIYGFDAVRSSLKALEASVADNPLALFMAKTALRVIKAVPPLKRRAFAGLGRD